MRVAKSLELEAIAGKRNTRLACANGDGELGKRRREISRAWSAIVSHGSIIGFRAKRESHSKLMKVSRIHVSADALHVN